MANAVSPTSLGHPIATYQLAFNASGGADVYATFDTFQQAMIRTSSNCYIDFDTPADPTRSMLMNSSDTQVQAFDFHGCNVKTIHAVGATGSGTLYIMVIQN